MNRDTTLTTLRRRVAQRVRHMTKAEALAWLERYNAESPHYGATIMHQSVRDLTGGYNSQSLNSYVVRKVYERSKVAA